MGRRSRKKNKQHFQIDNTWNIGEKEKKGLQRRTEKAVLVAIIRQNQTEEQVKEYLDELEFLAETAGAATQKVFIQKMPHPNQQIFVGKGKLEEIATYVEEHEIDLDHRQKWLNLLMSKNTK